MWPHKSVTYAIVRKVIARRMNFPRTVCSLFPRRLSIHAPITRARTSAHPITVLARRLCVPLRRMFSVSGRLPRRGHRYDRNRNRRETGDGHAPRHAYGGVARRYFHPTARGSPRTHPTTKRSGIEAACVRGPAFGGG